MERVPTLELPPPAARLAFVGPTGSGKSYLAREILRHYRNVIIVDPKHQWSWKRPRDEWYELRAATLGQLYKQLQAADATGQPVLYRPPPEDLLPMNCRNLDHVADLALQRRNTILYYDELVYISGSSDWQVRAPKWYQAMTTGRTRGVGVWNAFQRPSWVPMVALTEAEERFIFYLRNKDDRRRMEEGTGEDLIPWGTLRQAPHTYVISTDSGTTGARRLKGD